MTLRTVCFSPVPALIAAQWSLASSTHALGLEPNSTPLPESQTVQSIIAEPDYIQPNGIHRLSTALFTLALQASMAQI